MMLRQLAIAIGLLAVTCTALPTPAQAPDFEPMRAAGSGMGPSVELEPVIVPGARLPERQGTTIQDIALFRWNGSAYEPILYQIDERIDRTFNPGTDGEFTQNVHDVTGLDDGLLDGDDEIVFLFRSTGGQAPLEAAWPDGADNLRHELRVTDVTGEVTDPRYVYVFGGSGLERVSEAPISWDAERTSAISTELFSLDYVDRWLLLGYRVLAPCGDGGDLIDRFKGRAGILVEQSESEEVWNLAAFYMGGLVGPVRAIRYIRGAASGLNTIHHDVVYPDLWERHFALRVHPLDNVWFYFDWLPGRLDTRFSPAETAGVAIDGEPDPEVTEVQAWDVVRGDGGGLAMMYDLPPSPFVQNTWRYTRDDAEFDDATVFPGGYNDDDDSAIGNHGAHLDSLVGSDVDAIEFGFRAYPLCGGVGDAADGAGFHALWTTPPEVDVTAAYGTIEPVRDLAVALAVVDVHLDWEDVGGATAYRVYASVDPALPIESWTLETETTASAFVDSGAAIDPAPRFYRIAVLDGAGGEIF
jgi:hypothetical protein